MWITVRVALLALASYFKRTSNLLFTKSNSSSRFLNSFFNKSKKVSVFVASSTIRFFSPQRIRKWYLSPSMIKISPEVFCLWITCPPKYSLNWKKNTLISSCVDLIWVVYSFQWGPFITLENILWIPVNNIVVWRHNGVGNFLKQTLIHGAEFFLLVFCVGKHAHVNHSLLT